MEQSNQQIIQKPSLPIKTKIAAWWMIAVGVILLPLTIVMMAMFGFLSFWFFLPYLGLLILSGYYILRGKKWAWVVLLIVLLISTPIIGVYSVWNFFYVIMYFNWNSLLFSFSFCIFLIPLVLLFFDRKNFWKIAT